MSTVGKPNVSEVAVVLAEVLKWGFENGLVEVEVSEAETAEIASRYEGEVEAEPFEPFVERRRQRVAQVS